MKKLFFYSWMNFVTAAVALAFGAPGSAIQTLVLAGTMCAVGYEIVKAMQP